MPFTVMETDPIRRVEIAIDDVRAGRMVILVVGDKVAVGDDLVELGYGEPIELDIDGDPVVDPQE